MAGSVAPNIVTDGLVLYLDAGNTKSYSGATAWSDLSGGGNDGVLINGSTFSSSNGGCIVFDGNNDYITLNKVGLLSGWTSFTYNLWIYVNNVSTGYWTGWINSNTSSSGLNITLGQWNNQQKLWLEIDTNTGNYYGGGPGVTTFPLNQWFNVVMTYDGSKVTSYINTTLDTQFNASGTLNTISELTMAAPEASQNGGYLNGKISISQIYNRALSASEILQNYNATKSRFGL